MMTNAEKHVLDACESLLKKQVVLEEDYNQALAVLQPMEGILSSWMKGKIYMHMAETIAKSFQYKHYATDEQKKHYQSILLSAADHLWKVSCMMPTASSEIKDLLNPHIWYQIGKIDNEIKLIELTEDDSDNIEFEREEFKEYGADHIDSMIQQLEFWSV